MKRTIAFVLALVLLLSVCTACEKKEQSTTDGEQSTQTTASAPYIYPSSADNASVTVHTSEPPSGFSVTAVPDTLTVAQGGEPITLYPQAGNQLPAIIAMRPMYETLINYNSFTGEYEPRLAESWEMVDDETIRLTLRQGVKCHAGYEITAEDVLWTAQRGQEEMVAAFVWSAFDLSR